MRRLPLKIGATRSVYPMRSCVYLGNQADGLGASVRSCLRPNSTSLTPAAICVISWGYRVQRKDVHGSMQRQFKPGVEKYLLGEFSPAKEDESAEHSFGCQECASDLRVTSLFLDTTKRVFGTGFVPEARFTNRRWRMKWLPPQHAVAASVVFLAIILYQNVIVIPKLRQPPAPG